ncbi:RDD family protein [Duganella sp. FT50W]|uniref:RDD family protein n=1 Tax=Duganella lactea TaxID=2692173 RepID=A0A6L8MIE2_9BURK|nr:RDD family protein [Duganella lactea]MYM36105.1 RDD family protein [Duganella lactea]MYM82887.1 RDD family protein [Duganella lactea]
MSNNPVSKPTIRRRLISMVYEALLGFAVLFLPFLIFEVATGGSHTPLVEHMRQALAFLVLGAYFIHQWTREGQTLAMRTWRMKLVSTNGGPVTPRVAVVRYLLSWMWILPALIVALAADLHRWQALGAILIGIAAWSLTAFFDKDRQFLHDKLAGTRLVQLPPLEKKKKAASAA